MIISCAALCLVRAAIVLGTCAACAWYVRRLWLVRAPIVIGTRADCAWYVRRRCEAHAADMFRGNVVVV